MTSDIASHNKKRIAQQFSRAATTYDSAADVQLDIAFDAMALVPPHCKTGLDIGCGTGRISQQLATRCDALIAMDLAYGMLTYAQQNSLRGDPSVCWLQGDADSLPMVDNSVDMVFSSMVLQWANDPKAVMTEIRRVMAPGAQAVLAIMCDGSFSQLNQSWKNIDSQRHVNHFTSAKTWYAAAKSSGLQVNMQQKQYLTWHANIRQLLSSIKSIGANVLLTSQNSTISAMTKEIKGFNRHTLQHLESEYQKHFAKNLQLPLTYNVCLLHCKN